MESFWKHRWFKWGLAAVAIPVLAIAWWLGSPLLFDSEVDEGFPLSASALIPEGETQASVEQQMADAADLPEKEMNEEMPGDEMTDEETSGDDEPIALATGSFEGADDFHQGSGTVTLYELADGSRVVRFEDFDVTNGPDLHVLAVPNADVNDRDDIEGYVDLGKLKGNVGNQNYEVPADVTDIGSIVIYCEPFHVLFASASIS